MTAFGADYKWWEQTDLSADIQADGEVRSVGQTDDSQEVPEVWAGICGTAAN